MGETLLSSSISRITKSTRNVNLPTSTSIFVGFKRLHDDLRVTAAQLIKDHDYLEKYCKPIRTLWCIKGGPRRNKPDLDIMSFDDLYNNFKIVEQEVKGTATSSSSSSSQNMAFVSSPRSTNEVNTAYGVDTANIQVSLASTQD
nr:hypothetical protein [Tanacetum cinerariifolium]